MMAENEEGIPQYLDDRPDLKFLNRHVRKPLCAKETHVWKDVGIELLGGGSNDALDIIEKNNSDVTNCCSKMFQLWFDKQSTASWRQLIQALKQLQLDNLADQVASKLKAPIAENRLKPMANAGNTGQVLSKPQCHPQLTLDQLKTEFCLLLVRIRCILSEASGCVGNLEVCKEFCSYLKVSGDDRTPLFGTEMICEIDNCRDFKQFFRIINQYIKWDEHSILNEIIALCSSAEAEKELTKFKRKMVISKGLEIINSTKSDPPPGFEKFCIVIDQPYKNLTVEKYEEIKKFIFSNLDVHHYVTNQYIRALLGSLHLEWHVTTQAVPHMIKMAHQRRAVFTKNYYVFMQIGKEIIINELIEQTLVEWSKNPRSVASGIRSEIIPQHLDDYPVTKYLRHVKEEVCASGPEVWFDLGIELLDQKDLASLIAIKSDATKSLSERCSEMFKLWRERQPDASWRRLIIAMRKIRLNNQANDVEKLLARWEVAGVDQQVLQEGHQVPQIQPLISHDQLRAEFGRMIIAIRDILSRSPNNEDNLAACKELCIYLKASDSARVFLFSPEKCAEIKSCKDFRQLFRILDQHLNWDELSILAQVIDICDSDQAEKEFKNYKRKVAVSKALQIISSTKTNPPPGFAKFCVVIDKSYKKLTIEQYEEIKKFIFENLDTQRYVTDEYIRVLFDSVHLEWHVTSQAMPHMIQKANEQKAIFKESFFVFMQIGKNIIINIPTKQTSEVSKAVASVMPGVMCIATSTYVVGSNHLKLP